MHEIICPSCKKAFKIDEAGFADIVKQVRNSEFEAELHERIAVAEREMIDAVKLAEANTKNQLQAEIARRDTELAELRAKREAELAEIKSQKDSELSELRAERELTLTQLKSKQASELAELRAKLQSYETESKLAVTEAVNKVEKERDELASELKNKDTEQKLLATSMRDKYESELRIKDEMISQYKDLKARLSTKMVGETLEQHCEVEFNRLRATAFQNAYFEKDNDASGGTKGDYIYRETDENGTEIISIMFEMKNEGDETATKHKNEDFLAKLDRDRVAKKCEFAVLVSLLESDSELYNQGIVDMSHRHPKMYVIRPQFFIPMITLLRNAALSSLAYKNELAVVKSQNIDVTTFESDLQAFQDGFMKNVKDSSSKFQEAMDGIDTTIKKLENIKEALRLSNKHLLTAGSKVETVSVKRLTKNNPTMQAKFDELAN